MTEPFHPSSLRPFSLTHVLHDPKDPLGVAFAVSALVPIFLIVAYLTAFIARREAAILAMLLGQLLNEAINSLLKRTFEGPRPYPHIGDGHGMPSSHAQFMAFAAAYYSSYLFERIEFENFVWKVLLVLGVWGTALGVAYGRFVQRGEVGDGADRSFRPEYIWDTTPSSRLSLDSFSEPRWAFCTTSLRNGCFGQCIRRYYGHGPRDSCC